MTETEKIFCPNGHLLGLRYKDRVTIKHKGRQVTLFGGDGMKVEIVCEKCAEKRKFSL